MERYLNEDEKNKLNLLLRFLYEDVNEEIEEFSEEDMKEVEKTKRKLNMLIKINYKNEELRNYYNKFKNL